MCSCNSPSGYGLAVCMPARPFFERRNESMKKEESWERHIFPDFSLSGVELIDGFYTTTRYSLDRPDPTYISKDTSAGSFVFYTNHSLTLLYL